MRRYLALADLRSELFERQEGIPGKDRKKLLLVACPVRKRGEDGVAFPEEFKAESPLRCLLICNGRPGLLADAESFPQTIGAKGSD